MPVQCPRDYRCFQRQPSYRDDYPLDCVEDGVCDAETCETFWSCPDCSEECDPSRVTSMPQEFLVSAYASVSYDSNAPQFGVDLDGDGIVDNKWRLFSVLINSNTHSDMDEEIAREIAAGHLLVAARVFGHYPSVHADSSLVQLLLAEVHDATPVFGGSDEVQLAPDASIDVGMCGRDSERLYGQPFTSDTLRFPIPWPDVGGTVLVDLHRYFVQDTVDASGWQEFYVGGGISPSQVVNELLPMLAELITRTIASDPFGAESEILINLLDGNCVVMEDVPGCEAVVYGQGECDDAAERPVITVTELKCNALIHSALQPDIDSDGDGENDLISFGARLSAVPVTIVEN